jgi:hypothetical protein
MARFVDWLLNQHYYTFSVMNSLNSDTIFMCRYQQPNW